MVLSTKFNKSQQYGVASRPVCDICKKDFSNTTNLNVHKESAHTDNDKTQRKINYGGFTTVGAASNHNQRVFPYQTTIQINVNRWNTLHSVNNN